MTADMSISLNVVNKAALLRLDQSLGDAPADQGHGHDFFLARPRAGGGSVSGVCREEELGPALRGGQVFGLAPDRSAPASFFDMSQHVFLEQAAGGPGGLPPHLQTMFRQ